MYPFSVSKTFFTDILDNLIISKISEGLVEIIIKSFEFYWEMKQFLNL